MTIPLVSVVICTYHRADLLAKAIASLIEQRVDFEYEIVVVDNSSSDHTQDVIGAAIVDSPIPIRSVIEHTPGISAARNRSIREARGEWIASIDDDEIADPNWLQQLMIAAQRHAARCVGGRVELQLPSETIDALSPVCRDLLGESTLGDCETPYTRRITPSTCNVLIHRSVFEEVGGFDEEEKEGGEDTDLFRRIRQAGIVAWHNPHAILHHHVPDYRLNVTAGTSQNESTSRKGGGCSHWSWLEDSGRWLSASCRVSGRLKCWEPLRKFSEPVVYCGAARPTFKAASRC